MIALPDDAGDEVTPPGRVPLGRGRAVPGVLGLVGGVLLLPSLVWPATRVSSSPLGAADVIDVVELWTWGRFRLLPPNGPVQEPSASLWPVLAVVLAVVVVLAGAAAWTLRGGPEGRLLGGAGTAVGLGVVLMSASRRWGVAGEPQQDMSTVVETLPAGACENLALLSLAAALGLMVRRPVAALARPAWTWGRGLVSRLGARDEADTTESRDAPPRVGIARIRDVERRDQPGWHASDGVGFSDDRSSSPDRFEPPR